MAIKVKFKHRMDNNDVAYLFNSNIPGLSSEDVFTKLEETLQYSCEDILRYFDITRESSSILGSTGESASGLYTCTKYK